MAIRAILHYPDKRLREPGCAVTEFGPALQTLVEDMAETMYAATAKGTVEARTREQPQITASKPNVATPSLKS